mmetsp:Transcript_24478/g.28208  ORF Transcript_24478/g.28208 Transcript_24478/m.28208 type:complete len:99 (-) Transcript_24478:540-836(-)
MCECAPLTSKFALLQFGGVCGNISTKTRNFYNRVPLFGIIVDIFHQFIEMPRLLMNRHTYTSQRTTNFAKLFENLQDHRILDVEQSAKVPYHCHNDPK